MNDPSPLQKNPKGQDELSEQQKGSLEGTPEPGGWRPKAPTY